MKTLKTSWIVKRGEEVCALSNHLHDVNIPVNYRSFTALLSQVTPPLHHPPHGSSAQLSPDERQLFICYVWYTCLLGFSLFVLPTFSLKPNKVVMRVMKSCRQQSRHVEALERVQNQETTAGNERN